MSHNIATVEAALALAFTPAEYATDAGRDKARALDLCANDLDAPYPVRVAALRTLVESYARSRGDTDSEGALRELASISDVELLVEFGSRRGVNYQYASWAAGGERRIAVNPDYALDFAAFVATHADGALISGGHYRMAWMEDGNLLCYVYGSLPALRLQPASGDTEILTHFFAQGAPHCAVHRN